MGYQILLQYLFMLFMQFDFTYSKVHYITPSPNGPCPQKFSCLTLSQFAVDSSYNESDVSLFLLPGNHTLDRELLLAHRDNVSLSKDGAENETEVFVECFNQSARLYISGTTSATIKDLNFIGCVDNKVSHVSWLTISGTTFQGVTNRDSVLVLSEVIAGFMIRTSFLLNSGPLYITAFSNISIIDSKFTHNFGVAIVAHNSILYLSGNIYKGNTACIMDTTGTTIFVYNSTFVHNLGYSVGLPGVIHSHNDTLIIINSTFANNKGFYGAGVMVTYSSFINISNSKFINNSGHFSSSTGVMLLHSSSIIIRNSTFINNLAFESKGVLTAYSCSLIIIKCIFTKNNDAIFALSSSFDISYSIFTFNFGYYATVLDIYDPPILNISHSTFSNNTGSSDFPEDGSYGVMRITDLYLRASVSNCTFTSNIGAIGVLLITGVDDSITISNCTFRNNSGFEESGVIHVGDGSSLITISNCTFTNNRGKVSGVFFNRDAIILIENSNFINNTGNKGGVIQTQHKLILTKCNFISNRAIDTGGVIWSSQGTLTVADSKFSLNAAGSGGAVIFTFQCKANFKNITFEQNNGSLYTFNSDIIFDGYSKFENCTEALPELNHTSVEGGAITSFQSSLTFNHGSVVHFSNNRARQGGAILSTSSTISMEGKIIISNNMVTVASGNGGGISLSQTRLEIKENGICLITNNSAARGGGIHSSSSTIIVHNHAQLKVIDNSADLGGGIYFEVNAKLYIVYYCAREVPATFIGNHANYGGALYMADNTNAGACISDIECFVQVLSANDDIDVGDDISPTDCFLGGRIHEPVYCIFSNNVARGNGSSLFGGLLDRCVSNPYSVKSIGATYFDVCDIHDKVNTISSQAVRVCFCNDQREPDCTYQQPMIRVQKGKPFNITLVAVDQINNTVAANIIGSLSNSEGGFDQGQQTQKVRASCSDLTFNVFSLHDFETIILYPDGPCGSAELSTSHVTVQFINCTCPIGFEPLSSSETRCACDCDPALSPFITNCTSATSTAIREGTNSWITYINDSDPPGFVIHPNCPYDYCKPQTKKVIINFNLPKGEDSQCAFDRTGTLCGGCKENLSLSLASSRCVPCHTHWPAVFVVILLAAVIAGILLVTVLLALNMTVSVGLINGFIFYANIVSAGSAIFFPSSEPSFPSVFVAWLNLDIGIDVCFIDGLDAYTKT